MEEDSEELARVSRRDGVFDGVRKVSTALGDDREFRLRERRWRDTSVRVDGSDDNRLFSASRQVSFWKREMSSGSA